MKIVGLSIVINSFGVVQRAKFSIALNFRLQAVASLMAVIISGVFGVSLAYYGYGVWALIIQNLLNNFVNILLLWILSKWCPLWCFSWNSFQSLFFLWK
ncbi:oligosaccharide flippase family protein [Bacteroides thetaiotaomicron]|uniref:oligosaccharide flippase family protein n=1 Tax=Bacteroides thetaiotaomicron TaxID=818 RepID=UPI0039C8817F